MQRTKFSFWMGATKTDNENQVRWMSNNETIDPNHSAWENDPRTDNGQFYAERDNISCLYMETSASEAKWGKKQSNTPNVRGFCEKTGSSKSR